MSGVRWKQFIGAPGARSAAGAKPRGRPQFAASGQADSCGLTGRARPLYSAGFATSACRLMFEGPCGGIGRRARLKIEFRKECWFDSGQGHQLGCSSPFQSVRNRPRSARKPLKNRHFRVHSCSSPFVLLRSQPADLLVFLLVSCWYRENKRSRRLSLFRTKGIEQMARKNDGACANPKQIRTDVDCRAARPCRLRQGSLRHWADRIKDADQARQAGLSHLACT